ncbi:MAG: T9SS type A sorting domain-containing protein [Candidatus Marinimicrobia bacterium]|nr:T9SS type A sorting domain-containing protein [Candidatus Neomarinimicrobiota bacterium]
MPETLQAMSLQVFDINGRLITTLIDGQIETGFHTIEWNAEGYPSGLYFVKLDAGDPSSSSEHGFTQNQKLILLK